MKIPLFLLFLLNSLGLWAQDSTVVNIRAGSSYKDVLNSGEILLYPQFLTGSVFFRDGTKSIATLNYNSFTDQMLFIDYKKDTLAVADEMTISYISIAEDTFYYNEGYLKLVTSNSLIKLAERQAWEQIDIRKVGSHDRPATTFAVASYSSLTDWFGSTKSLILNEDLVIRKRAIYFFGDKYDHFMRADKKNLLAVFSRQERIILNYLKTNKTRFDSRSDLIALTRFLQSQ